MTSAVKMICAALFLFLVGLPAPREAQPFASRLYVPLFINTPHHSKIGVAPGGYLQGDLAFVGAAWAYTWDNKNPLPDAEQIDMISGADYLTVALRSSVVLGFNEPDLAGMSPEQGAALWRQVEALHPDKCLVSPAPSQFDPGWLWRMVDAYRALYHQRPQFCGVAVHYYRLDDDMPLVSDYVQSIRAVEQAHGYDAPIWLTEIGACWADEIATLDDMVTFANDTEWVARAAWYKLRPDWWDVSQCSSLLDDNGLTALGVEYRRLAGGQ